MSEHTTRLLRAGLLSFTMLVPAASHALVVTQNDNAMALADSLFLNIPGLTVNSAELFGAPEQSGTYTNVIGTYGLPQNGIVFSSGNAADYGAGGNSSTGTSTSFDEGFGESVFVDDNGNEVDPGSVFFDENTGQPFFDDGNGGSFPVEEVFTGGEFGNASENQNALLNPITGSDRHFDVVQLNIEFETAANVSQVTFFGAFGSEEWPEFVGQFNDGFGLYVNGENQAGVSEFNSNTPLPINIDHPSMAAITGTELDGVLAPGSNPVLRFDVDVDPGSINNFTIILADTNDSALDTTVYLSSFIAANPGGGGGTPVPATGASEFDPLLPILNDDGEPVFDENGGFIIDITAEQWATGETIWIDPPVTVGYTYAIDGGNLFTHITLPSLASVADLDGMYDLLIGGVLYEDISASVVFDIFDETGLLGVDTFTVTGIDVGVPGLDPANVLAFPIGIMSNATAGASVTITPITENTDPVNPAVVPLPATGLLYLGAVLMGGGLLHRRSKKA